MEKAEEFPRLQPLGAINELPPLPRAAGTSYATGLSYYGEDQMRSYAQAAIAALEAETQRLREVVSKVNDRCDHLGMSLGEIKAERDNLKALLTKEFGSGWEDFDAAHLRVANRKIAALEAECAELRKDAATVAEQCAKIVSDSEVPVRCHEDAYANAFLSVAASRIRDAFKVEGQEP